MIERFVLRSLLAGLIMAIGCSPDRIFLIKKKNNDPSISKTITSMLKNAFVTLHLTNPPSKIRAIQTTFTADSVQFEDAQTGAIRYASLSNLNKIEYKKTSTGAILMGGLVGGIVGGLIPVNGNDPKFSDHLPFIGVGVFLGGGAGAILSDGGEHNIELRFVDEENSDTTNAE